jgi:RNA-directed DNA polymerase
MAPPQVKDVLLETVALCPSKVRNLLKLGTSKRQAIMTAISRKGHWHFARTMAAQTGMTNKWLTEQGLISVKEQWVKIHYPATAR